MRSTVSLLAIAMSLQLAGCVAKSTYLEKVSEASHLEETVQSTRAEISRLQEEKSGLLARGSDLGQQLNEALARNADLQSDLTRARADLDRLETVLSARSQETGTAMAAMRRNIDALHEQMRRQDEQAGLQQEEMARQQEENRRLVAQLEAEQIAREARVAQVQSTYGELVDKMEAEIERGEITISELQGKLTVNLVERILFDSGKADVKTAGFEVLQRVGEILRGVQDKEVVVEGHTDNLPIGSRLRSTFPSNWELSVSRAVNVLHILQERVGIPGDRLSASGFGEFRPIADNSTPEGRAQNRRIQIVLVPLEGRVIEKLE